MGLSCLGTGSFDQRAGLLKVAYLLDSRAVYSSSVPRVGGRFAKFTLLSHISFASSLWLGRMQTTPVHAILDVVMFDTGLILPRQDGMNGLFWVVLR